jgi:hypothetical protein
MEYDRVMALMPRKAIYSFDVYLLAMLFDRAASFSILRSSGGGSPKNHRSLSREYLLANFVRNSSTPQKPIAVYKDDFVFWFVPGSVHQLLSQPTDFIVLALSFASGLLVTELALDWIRGRRK